MDTRTAIYIGIGLALLAAVFLFNRGGSAPKVTTVSLAGDTSARAAAIDAASKLEAQKFSQQFQLDLAMLQGSNQLELAKLQSSGTSATAASNYANQQAAIQATIQGRLQELQAQAALQRELLDAQNRANRNSQIWQTIGGIGSGIIGGIFGNRSGGGFGGVRTPPFSNGIDFADWVRSIPVGGSDPYSTQVIDACSYDPLCSIRRREQNQLIPLGTPIDGLGITPRPFFDLPSFDISSRFGSSPDSWLTNTFGGGGGGYWDSFSKIDTSRYWEL